jgi:peptidoglycan L-alanyl-D-glutamate endopeptidase CwlK
MNKLGKTSLERLATCDEALQILMYEAIKCGPDFAIICGFRDQADQDKAFAQGYSKVKWPNGKHNRNPSVAVDIAPVVVGSVIWDDKRLFSALAAHVKECASNLGIEVEWGGDWTDFVDLPHWQLKEKA